MTLTFEKEKQQTRDTKRHEKMLDNLRNTLEKDLFIGRFNEL